MFNRDDIVVTLTEFCKTHNIELKDITAIAGSAMVMQGLRPGTSDIDCTTDGATFQHVVKLGGYTPIHREPLNAHVKGITVIETPEGVDMGAAYVALKEPRECYKGVYYASVRDTLDFKRAMNRAKDQADIETLLKALGE